MSLDLGAYLLRIDTKIDKLDDHLKIIDVTLARNTLSLEVHMARTSALEALVEVHKRAVEPVRADVSAIYTVLYFGRWLLSCSAIAGVATAVYKWLT